MSTSSSWTIIIGREYLRFQPSIVLFDRGNSGLGSTEASALFESLDCAAF